MRKTKLKILLLGPCGSGKSGIANVLSDTGAKWNPDKEFRLQPTKALRIVEFELADVGANNEKCTAEIELWDCSGDDIYKNCWPALRHDTNGVVFTYAHGDEDVVNRKMETLYDYFITQTRISPRQCLLVHHQLPDNVDVGAVKLSSSFARLSQITVNLSTDVNKLKNEFKTYITSLLSHKTTF